MAQPRKSSSQKIPSTKQRGTGSGTKRTATSKASSSRTQKTPTTGSPGTKRSARAAPESAHFSQARTRAARVLQDPEATEKLVGAAQKRTEGKRAGHLSKIIDELKGMLRLVRAYATGDYRAVSWESMVLVVAALIYLVSPVDVIPDVLPFGLADDATVIMFVLGLVNEELETFMDWERARGDGGAGAP